MGDTKVRSLREVFRDNRKYISRMEMDPVAIREQFVESERRHVVKVGDLPVPSGKLIVGDPLAFLSKPGDASKVLEIEVTPGKYPVEISFCRTGFWGSMICTLRVKFRETDAARYEFGKIKGSNLAGAPVDAGLMTVVDEQVLKEYHAFLNKWYEENPEGNVYDEYFMGFFQEEAKKDEKWQRNDGSYLDWTIPDTEHTMQFVSTGFGDGLYSAFWGFDEEGQVTELILPFADSDDLEMADKDFERLETQLPKARYCISSNKIRSSQKIGYLYRVEPSHGPMDSGWLMFEGSEDEEYTADPLNANVTDIMTMCIFSPGLVKILDAPIGSAFILNEAGEYEQVHDEPEQKDEGAPAEESVDQALPNTEEWISDDDPIYELLDEWNDKNEYDKILAKVEEIPFERRSNKLWFQKISALNNLSRYEDARREIAALNRRCVTPEDKGELLYMLGYIYDNTDCELMAVELYRASLEADPNRTGTQELIESGLQSATRNIDKTALALKKKFEENREVFQRTEKKKLEELKAYAFLGLINATMIPVAMVGLKMEPANPLFKYEESQRENVRKLLKERCGLTDIKSLQKYFANNRIAFRMDDVRDYLKGESKINVDQMGIAAKNLWDVTVMCREKMESDIPKGGLEAWDFNEMVGLARLMYAADLLTNTELFETYLFAFDQCKELFSSWEEYSRSLTIGGFYNYLTKETKYNIQRAGEFALMVANMCAHTYPYYEWLDRVDV